MSAPLGTMYFLLDKSSLDRKSLQAMQTIASVSTYFFIHMAYDIVNLLWPSMAVSPKKFQIVELTPVQSQFQGPFINYVILILPNFTSFNTK